MCGEWPIFRATRKVGSLTLLSGAPGVARLAERIFPIKLWTRSLHREPVPIGFGTRAPRRALVAGTCDA
jgi:hypothetical protein